jgi:autotransporter-associated beta strand protein
MGILSFGSNTTVNFGGLTGTNDVALTNVSGVAVTLRIRGAQTCVYDGHLVGGCDFVKTGSGSFTLKNANSYTGRTSLVNGKLIVPSEDVLGVAPAAFVQNQISLEGGTLRSSPGSNFVLGAGTRGATLTSGGTLEIPDYTNTFTVAKPMTGSGWLAKRGSGVLLLACSNAYDGVTLAAEGLLRIAHSAALGSAVGGTVVATGAQLELAAGVVVSNESLSINGAGMTVGNAPPSAPQFNRGALQAGTNATAEWSGPVLLTPGECRIGAQDGGHLIVSLFCIPVPIRRIVSGVRC